MRPNRIERGLLLLNGALLVVSNAGFLLLMALLMRSNRLCVDDFAILAAVRRQGGILACIGWFWHNWTGRWFSILVTAAVDVWAQADGKLFYYNLVTLLCFWLALWSLLRCALATLSKPRPGFGWKRISPCF